MARVFLSYADPDKPAVERIRDSLREVGHHPWFDEDDILVGDSIPAKIEQGLREADYVVVCLSAASVASQWAEAERNVSLMARRAGGPPRVLPVRLEDVDAPGMLAHVKSVDLFPEDRFDAGFSELLQAITSTADDAALDLTRRIPSLNSGPPMPRYEDAGSKALSDELRNAFTRKRLLAQAGVPTEDVDAEILRLKRAIRSGGQLRAGDVLGGGRYLLLKPIGHGGFANVWEALDGRYGDKVAVKVLHSELRRDPVRRDRFFRGARKMAELSHDAIVRIRDPGGEDDGYCFFVMELITGGDLHEAVIKKTLATDRMKLALGVGNALAVAHGHGLVHRDVKPANILLTESEHPRLTDFDLVAAADTTGGTRTGALGTFLYTAPEMLDRPQDADQRADVYSLGMTIAFMLHGEELPKSIFGQIPRFIGKLPCAPELVHVLQRAVAWERDDRFPDANGFVHALHEARDDANAGRDALTKRHEAALASRSDVARAAPQGKRKARSSDETRPINQRKKLAEQRREPPNPRTLKDLLREIRQGYTLYRPILIEVEQGTRVAPDATIDRTMTLRRPLDWAEQYGREYAGNPYVLLGPNKLSAGVETPVTVGRSRRCDVRVENDSVSKVHGSIVFDRTSGEYYVVDENSRNGTYINGEQLTPGVPAPVWSGAYVSFGDAVFVFIDPPTLRKLAKLSF